MRPTVFVLLAAALASVSSGQSWQNGPQSPFAYSRFDAEYFPATGKVYFLGGRVGTSTTSGRIYTYNPADGTYADEAVDMPKAVSNYDVCLLQDDYDLPAGDTHGLYIVGGRYDQSPNYTDSLQVYYPISKTARVFPTDPFPGRAGGQITVALSSIVYDNVIYSMGGFSQTSNVTTNESWRFDPLAPSGSRWVKLPNLVLARAYPNVAVVDSFLFAFGGDTWQSPNLVAKAQSQRFNLNDTAAGWSLVAPMPGINGEARAFGFDSDHPSDFAGKVIVAGRGTWSTESAHCYIYDVAADNWASFPSLAQRRRNHAGVYIPPEAGGTGVPGIWVFGGRQSTDTSHLRISEYYAIDIVGVEEGNSKFAPLFSLAPNPCHDVVTVRFGADRPDAAYARLFDIAGREIVSRRLAKEDLASPVRLDVRGLPNGVYLFRLDTGRGSQEQKLVVYR